MCVLVLWVGVCVRAREREREQRKRERQRARERDMERARSFSRSFSGFQFSQDLVQVQFAGRGSINLFLITPSSKVAEEREEAEEAGI